MHFKKYAILLCCLILGYTGFSQEEDDISQGFYARYQAIGNFKLADWNAFADGYNATVNPNEQLGGFQQRFCYDLGYRFTFNRIYTSLSWQHYQGRATASFANNESRQFDLFANAISWGFGMKLGKSNRRLSFSPFINIRLGDKLRIVSEFIYADGFHSLGNEKEFNGTFIGSGLLGEELGLLMKYRLNDKFALELEVSKMWANSVTPSVMDDKSVYKAFTGDGAGASIPQDYALYNGDPIQYTLDNGKYLTDKISATKLLVGISYTFLRKKNGSWWQ
jgi:hypothetical protein